MGLKIENIYKDIYLYIFIVLILIFIFYKKVGLIKRMLEKKWVNIYIMLIISFLLNFKFKIGIITTVIYILIIF